jgi:hypothetical protein
VQNTNRCDGQRGTDQRSGFSRYQGLRMDLPKSTGRLFAISASRTWITKKALQAATSERRCIKIRIQIVAQNIPTAWSERQH